MPTNNISLNAGPLLDSRVAKQVMGWLPERVHGETLYLSSDKTTYRDSEDFAPSADIADAWEVVEEVGRRGWGFELRSDNDGEDGPIVFYCAVRVGLEDFWDIGDTAAEAICLAALLAAESIQAAAAPT